MIENIPTLEVPGLEQLVQDVDGLRRGLVAVVERIEAIEAELGDIKKVSGTVLSGYVPGGMIHDRVAEVRAAVKELLDDPSQPHHAAQQAALRLSWGSMGVES